MDNNDILEELERRKFDMVIVDSYYPIRCYYLIPHRLQIPWISYSIVGTDPFTIRAPWLPSIAPDVVDLLTISPELAFADRLKNTVNSLAVTFLLPLYFPELADDVLEKYRRYGYFVSSDELQSKTVLWLLGVGDILDYPRPMMPNMVSIAGLTVRRSADKLPSDIKNFIDGADKGVVLTTFGTSISTIPADALEKFSLAFRRLNGYRVLWKLNNKDNVILSDNVMTSQWLPQNDILSHPFVKLFITHGGAHGLQEAVYHGVPMIAFPIVSDQQYNARRMDHKGYGTRMDLKKFTSDELLENINKILSDKSYRERVTKASEIFRSQAQNPVEKATFWIEHVCRFGGDHLRSASSDLPLYSYFMLDVLAFILMVLNIFVYLLYRLLRFIIVNICRGYSTSNDNSWKKTN